jgi:hypothetical protein
MKDIREETWLPCLDHMMKAGFTANRRAAPKATSLLKNSFEKQKVKVIVPTAKTIVVKRSEETLMPRRRKKGSVR